MAKATESDKDVTNMLEQLATQARNSEQGYRTSAQDAKDGDLRSIFSDLSRERSNQADELDRIIQRLGGTPPSREGSTAGAAHRMWVDLKSALTGSDRRSILREIVRGESYAEENYDKALKMNLPEDVRQTVQQQHASIRASRDRFRSMLESIGEGQHQGGMMSSISGGVGGYVVERPVMGTALAFGTGMLIGVLLAMTMRSGGSSYGGRQGSYGSSADYTRYGGRSGYSGAQGYGYGATSQTSQTRYGDEGQATWR